MNQFQTFCKDLETYENNLDYVISKYFVVPKSFYFNQKESKEDTELIFRSRVAEAFEVHISNVIISGSAMTGFSLNPKKNLRLFDSHFSITNARRDKSDIDIAIISDGLFTYLSDKIYDFTNSYKTNWTSNLYNPNFNKNLKYNLLLFLARGWFRPDFCPDGFLERALKGYALKEILQNEENRKVSFAFYKSWFFYESVHRDNLKKNIIPLVKQTKALT